MRYITITGIVLIILSLTISIGAAQSDDTGELSDDIEDYEGSIGPDSALYGLKITFEELDETFTFNSSEKIDKQVAHARQRISEAKTELKKNNEMGAEKALERYRVKIKETNESVLRLEGNNSGLLQSQRMIIKHQYVLERLLSSRPNNTGLQQAYENSLKLEEKFELKTQLKIERVITKDKRIILKERKREKSREKIEVKAEIIGNSTQVKVEVEFLSNETDRDAIAKEILKRMRLSRENISDIIKIEVKEEDEKLEDKLKAEAKVEHGISEVEAEFKFPLNKTNRTDIIEGTYKKLSALTVDNILDVLEIEVEKEEKREKIKEITKIKAEIIGNSTQVKVEVEFSSNRTDSDAIAEEILNRMKLSRKNISDLIKIEVGGDEKPEEKLKAEAKIETGIAEIDAEFKFSLNSTNKTQIVEGTYQKLAALTTDDILNVLNIKTKDDREIKDKEEKSKTKNEKKEIEENKTERERKEIKDKEKTREEEQENEEER